MKVLVGRAPHISLADLPGPQDQMQGTQPIPCAGAVLHTAQVRKLRIKGFYFLALDEAAGLHGTMIDSINR